MKLIAATAVFSSLVLTLVVVAPGAAAACTRLERELELPCADGGFVGNAAELSGSKSTPGNPGTYDPATPVDPSKMTAAERDAWDAARAQYAAANGLPYRDSFVVRSPATTPITLDDIASFRPTVGSNMMEPNGWMVVGLPANFYATTAAHVVDGTLLGFPASVRFTPVSWSWTYGDGSSRASATGGATWAALGLPEFEPTATSHVFSAPGTFTIQLSVSFAAEYRFGGPIWVPIAGTLAVPSNPIVATAGDAQTVLVARDCIANPQGVGC